MKKLIFDNRKTGTQFFKFVIVGILNSGINYIVALAVNTVTLKWFVFYMKLAPEIGQLFTIVFSLTVNFLGNKLWTFRRAHEVV